LGKYQTSLDCFPETNFIFGFEDANRVSSLTAQANWSHRYSPFFSLRLRYQFDHVAIEGTPFFAGRTNVSGEAGIAGNNQDPQNWGPPALLFSSGLAGLSGAAIALHNVAPFASAANSSSVSADGLAAFRAA
jgi:hypothetical protein